MIKDTIEAVVSNLDQRCKFIYAPEYEANLITDSEESETDWFFVYVPPSENTDTIGMQREYHTSFPLVALIVKNIKLETIDYSALEVQVFVDQAREIGRNFIHKLGYESVIDYNPTYANGIQSAKYFPLKGEFDSHLFGVELQATVPIYEGKTGC
jgi:hypothetical protein